jgi:hypothetical protein
LPAASPKQARDEAVRHLIRTFFNGSGEQTIAAVLRVSDSKLSEDEIARLQQRIRKAQSREDDT